MEARVGIELAVFCLRLFLLFDSPSPVAIDLDPLVKNGTERGGTKASFAKGSSEIKKDIGISSVSSSFLLPFFI